MTDQATQVVPAGWYEDPSNPDIVRWWNGIAWTDHTQPKPDSAHAGETSVKPTTPAPTAPRSVGATSIAADATTTLSSRLLAFSPLLFLAAVVAAISMSLYVTTSPAPWVVLVVPFGLCVFWAFRDSAALRKAGHSAPSPLWSLLGPLGYLVARKLAVPGWGSLATFIGIVVAVAAAHTAVWSTGLAAPVELAIRIQTEIRDDLVGSGAATAVACPPITESTSAGTIYTCDATLADGTHRSIIVSIDSDAGEFSYSFR